MNNNEWSLNFSLDRDCDTLDGRGRIENIMFKAMFGHIFFLEKQNNFFTKSDDWFLTHAQRQKLLVISPRQADMFSLK